LREHTGIAILGGSNKSAVGRAHVAAIRLTGLYKLDAGFMSRDKIVNRDSAEEYGIPFENVFDSLPELIEYCKKSKLAVVVCTPTDQHLQQVNDLLDAGLKVICEKSLGSELAPLVKLLEKPNSDIRNLVVIYNYTSYPAMRKIRDLVANGSIGKILQVNASMPQESFLKVDSNGKPVQPQTWRLKDLEIPTLSLDLGVHLHMLVKMILEKRALKVLGKESSNGNFADIVDDVRCIAEYENDIEVNFWFSKIAIGNRNGLRLEVYGQKGSLIWQQTNPEEIIHSRNDGTVIKIDRGSPDSYIQNDYKYSYFKPGHPTGFIEALSNYYVDIHKVMFDGISTQLKTDELCSVYGLEESLEGFILLKTISESSKERKWKKVEYL